MILKGQAKGRVWKHSRHNILTTECVLAVQGHSSLSKGHDLGTNQKRVCDFLLVINSNYGPILHRF